MADKEERGKKLKGNMAEVGKGRLKRERNGRDGLQYV